jgi:two-component system nitrogen regulation sensor histidine kinase NtrY
LTLVVVFGLLATAFVGVLVPFQREQRERLVEHERRLLSVLRDQYQRAFIYDLLSENEDSLAVDLAALAQEPGMLWVRIEIEPGALDYAATGDREAIDRALGAELQSIPVQETEAMVLILSGNAPARLLGTGGRPLFEGHVVEESALPEWREDGANGGPFIETHLDGQPVLYLAEDLGAAGEVFGQLHLIYSLAQIRQSEVATSRIFYGLVATAFALLLALLNQLISRIVIRPVMRVLDAMSHASTGDLRVRLPVHSNDEIGAIARSFNSMVGELEGSKKEIEEYSRNLETMVEARTRALRDSEQTLRGVKNHLATVIETVATGVISVDRDGRITTFNSRAAQILVPHSAPAEGELLASVLAPEAGGHLVRFLEDVGQQTGAVKHDELVIRRSQGWRTLSLVGSALADESGRRDGAVLVIEDLTDLLASQRLQAWKEAVERVIHEIKNPLTPVGLAGQTLKTAYSEDRDKFDELFPAAIDMILGAVRSLKALISEFTRFSRLPEVKTRPEDLNALVREALAPYENATVRGVTVRTRLLASPAIAEIDRAQIERVLLNIVNNGIEAMEGKGGVLELATELRNDPPRVCVRVSDEGPGVEDVDRLFEPHYTTKIKGTGLGLAIARQIVDEHHGEIEVESELGKGTTVILLLPTPG